MISPCPVPGAAGWLAGLRLRARDARIPLAATLELTRRCGLRCRHCYLGDRTLPIPSPGPERDTASVCRSLDEWVEAGCLFLLITGGEPMLRPDFPEVYRHACGRGLLTAVFSSGLEVTGRIVETFREFPPRKVEISLYGATAGTHEAVTRVRGSHGRAWDGIRRLLDGGIRVALKTMLLAVNQHEIEALAAQAEALGCPFRYDAAVFPCLAGGPGEALALRADPAAVVKHDLATPERRRRWARVIRSVRDLPESDRVYSCGAGATGFASDPYGNLSPCLLAAHYRVPCRPGHFRKIWLDELGALRHKRRLKRGSLCAGALRGAATHCPAFNYLETGDEERDSSYMMETARLRYEAVRATEEGADL